MDSNLNHLVPKRARPLLLTVSLWLVFVGATGCTQDFRVRRADGTSAEASATFTNAAVAPSSAQQCIHLLRHAGADPAAQAERRDATRRLVAMYGQTLLTARNHTLRVPTESGPTLTVTLRRGEGRGGVDPSEYVALAAADDFVVDHVDQRSRTSGEGLPLVGTVRATTPVNAPGVVPPQSTAGVVRALTAVASVSRGISPIVTLDLYDPHTVSQRLAADYTTPIALNLALLRPQRRGLRGLMSGDDFSASGLYPLENPTPYKTPLVFVHGLIADPGDFYYLENYLAGSEEVRRHYQVWVFYYPTSLPVVYSAMLLREDLDLFVRQLDPRGVYPALHRAVLIGHSMGGLLSRLAVSGGGERYYRHFFREPIDQLSLSAADRRLVRRALYAPATINVRRVVFIATPHHGSVLAGGPLGNLGRLLLHMPSSAQQQLLSVLGRNPQAIPAGNGHKLDSSLDSLKPGSPLIEAINDIPIRPGVHLHSIIGNRGRGGPLERSSDGIVPYTSSHLPQAESEKVVPAGHSGTLLRPETSAEIVRLLRQ